MSQTDYQQYIEQQAQLFQQEDLELQAQKQTNERNLQLVYDDLLKRFHLLQETLKTEQTRSENLKEITHDYISKLEAFNERVIEVPFSLLHNMFLLQEHPTSVFLCVTADNGIKWAKAPDEMNDQRIS